MDLAGPIDAVTFFIAAVTLIFLYNPSPKRTDLGGVDGKPRKSFLADIKIGAMYIWDRRPLLWLLGTFVVANFTGGPIGVFEPLIVKFNLAADWAARGMTIESALAMLSTINSLGGITGGVLISTWGGLKRRRVNMVLGGIMAVGGLVSLIGLSESILMAGIFSFLTALVLCTHHQCPFAGYLAKPWTWWPPAQFPAGLR